jgi:hypothetical protein
MSFISTLLTKKRSRLLTILCSCLAIFSLIGVGIVGAAAFTSTKDADAQVSWSFTSEADRRSGTNTYSNSSSNNNYTNYSWNDCENSWLNSNILVCSLNNRSREIYYTNTECVKSKDASSVLNYSSGYKYDFNSGDYCRPVGSSYYTVYSDAQSHNPQVIYVNINLNTNSTPATQSSNRSSITYTPPATTPQSTISYSSPTTTTQPRAVFSYTPPKTSDVIVPTESVSSTISNYPTPKTSSLPSYDWVDYGNKKPGNKQDLSLTNYKGQRNQELVNLTNNYANQYGYSAGDKNMINDLKTNGVVYCGSGSSSNCNRWAISFDRMKELSESNR